MSFLLHLSCGSTGTAQGSTLFNQFLVFSIGTQEKQVGLTFKVKIAFKMGEQRWMGFILLSFVWIILLKQVDGTRLFLQTPPTVANPWLHLPNIFPPISQPSIPKFNFSLLPISLPQLTPRFSSPPQSQPPRPSLMPNMPGSIPPSTLPTWPTFSIPPLPSFPWSIPSSPPPSFPWTIPSPPTFPWSIPSPPPPSFPWTNLTNPLPTIPLLPWNSKSPPPPNSQSFPWNNLSPPLQNNPTFPWLTPSPPPPNSQSFLWDNPSPPLQNNPTFPWLTPSPPPPNVQTFPLTNVTNPLPTIPSFPWSIPSPPPNSPLFPWIIPSPPPQSFPWNYPSPPPPFLNFPWLNLSPPPIVDGSPLPPFGLPPSNPNFPTSIQFTFSNFTQSWLPEAGVKVTWQSVISVELSLQLFVEALVKPITLIISSIQGNPNGPRSWSWSNGLTDSKLDANIGALCTMSGKDGFPVKGIVVVQTPIDDAVSTTITWFTILFNGWSKDTPPKATLDHTLGSFGGFVTNTTTTNLKTFCSHPTSLNSIATKQGQYVLN